MSVPTQQRGAPGCDVQTRKPVYITAKGNQDWSRFWGGKAAGEAWQTFMRNARQVNLGGWWDARRSP